MNATIIVQEKSNNNRQNFGGSEKNPQLLRSPSPPFRVAARQIPMPQPVTECRVDRVAHALRIETADVTPSADSAPTRQLSADSKVCRGWESNPHGPKATGF